MGKENGGRKWRKGGTAAAAVAAAMSPCCKSTTIKCCYKFITEGVKFDTVLHGTKRESEERQDGAEKQDMATKEGCPLGGGGRENAAIKLFFIPSLFNEAFVSSPAKGHSWRKSEIPAFAEKSIGDGLRLLRRQ